MTLIAIVFVLVLLFYIHQLHIGTFIVAVLHDTFRKLRWARKKHKFDFPLHWLFSKDPYMQWFIEIPI